MIWGQEISNVVGSIFITFHLTSLHKTSHGLPGSTVSISVPSLPSVVLLCGSNLIVTKIHVYSLTLKLKYATI